MDPFVFSLFPEFERACFNGAPMDVSSSPSSSEGSLEPLGDLDRVDPSVLFEREIASQEASPRSPDHSSECFASCPNESPQEESPSHADPVTPISPLPPSVLSLDTCGVQKKGIKPGNGQPRNIGKTAVARLNPQNKVVPRPLQWKSPAEARSSQSPHCPSFLPRPLQWKSPAEARSSQSPHRPSFSFGSAQKEGLVANALLALSEEGPCCVSPSSWTSMHADSRLEEIVACALSTAPTPRPPSSDNVNLHMISPLSVDFNEAGCCVRVSVENDGDRHDEKEKMRSLLMMDIPDRPLSMDDVECYVNQCKDLSNSICSLPNMTFNEQNLLRRYCLQMDLMLGVGKIANREARAILTTLIEKTRETFRLFAQNLK